MGKKRVYMDFGAAAPLVPAARRALVRALSAFGNPSAPHQEGRDARDILERARRTIAASLRVKAEEIVFTSGGTESNMIALTHIKARHVVTTALEHSSIVHACRALEARGTRVSIVEPHADGRVRAEDVLAALSPETDLVSIHHVQSELGTIQPIADIARAVRKISKTIIHVDAAQSPLWLDASPHTLCADMMTYDAHKVGGPKGVGLLYRSFDVPLLLAGSGTQERGARPGTENVAAAAGAAAAFELAIHGRITRAKKIAQLRDALWEGIHIVVPNARVLGSMKHRVANNLFVAFPGIDGDYLSVLLDKEGIAVTPRSACLGSGGARSEAAYAITHDDALSRSTLRFSLGSSSTVRDIKITVQAIARSLAVNKVY